MASDPAQHRETEIVRNDDSITSFQGAIDNDAAIHSSMNEGLTNDTLSDSVTERKGPTATNSSSSTTGSKSGSVADSFPTEIILMILKQISAEELTIAAAHLPRFWRKVIESIPALTSGYHPLQLRVNYCYLNFELPTGILKIVLREADYVEGFVFLPKSNNTTLRVVDLAQSSLETVKSARCRTAHLELRDCEGGSILSHRFSSRVSTRFSDFVFDRWYIVKARARQQKLSDVWNIMTDAEIRDQDAQKVSEWPLKRKVYRYRLSKKPGVVWTQRQKYGWAHYH